MLSNNLLDTQPQNLFIKHIIPTFYIIKDTFIQIYDSNSIQNAFA